MTRAPKSYNTSIDLNGNQIHNVVIHNLTSHPGTSEIPPKEGQLYFNTSSSATIGKRLFLWDNTKWVDLTDKGITLSGGLQDVVDINKTADRIELLHRFTPKEMFIRSDEFSGVLYASSISSSANGGYYVYGNWRQFGGNMSYGLFKANDNGTVDLSFDTGTGVDAAPYDNAKIEEHNGLVYISGSFTQYKGVPSRGFLCLTLQGAISSSFSIGTGFNGFTTSFIYSPNNKLYIGGLFSSYNGTEANNIVALDLSGAIDSIFIVGTGFNNTVVSIVECQDGGVVVTGYFSSYKGIACSNIIKLLFNGDIDQTFIAGTGFNTDSFTTNKAICTEDNKVLVVGAFTEYNGVSANRIIKLNQDGSIDSSFLSGVGFNEEANSISLLESGKYLINGSFTSYNGVVSSNSIILNLDGTVYQVFSTEETYFNISGDRLIAVSDTLECLVEYHGGEIISASSFTFDPNTGKAEYNIGGLSTTSEAEILPKRLIKELISNETKSSFESKLDRGTYSGTAADLKEDIDALALSTVNDRNLIVPHPIPESAWDIVHNMGKYPSIKVLDNYGNEVEAEVAHIDINHLEVRFSTIFAGRAVLN